MTGPGHSGCRRASPDGLFGGLRLRPGVAGCHAPSEGALRGTRGQRDRGAPIRPG